ncbi:peptidase S1 [Arthrobacter sp. ZBG10]|uniref:S1C family serine protease n=1 Tax=Arthrobacter sp. ZBG10 TaxID=1676590 RepID=UPI0006815494|nr:serine protease [Arthrobacter sp. ZBG10]KNH21734.1 peptidase S1 [Arthrobacter sp. ZBG10]
MANENPPTRLWQSAAGVAVAGLLLAGCSSPSPQAPTQVPEAGGQQGPTLTPTPTPSVSPTPTLSVTPTPRPTPTAITPKGWPAVVAEVRSGVGQFSVTGCEFSATGTGFLIAPDLVVTAAHVVDDASAISIAFGGEPSVEGVVLGFNELADLALVRINRPVAGHQLQFQEAQPPIGTDVAALGFPLGEPLTLTRGIVSGLDREVNFGSGRIGNMIQTDAAINPGNSGGPLLDEQGFVTGIISAGTVGAEGMSYAVAAPRAAEAVAEWQLRGVVRAPVTCGNAPAPNSGFFPMTISSNHDQATNIGQALLLHGQGINRGAYSAAFKQFTPELGASFGGEAEWSKGLGSSYWTKLDVVNVTGTGDSLVANVSLRTRQDAAHGVAGQTCSDWRIAYTVVWDGAAWLIAGTALPHGNPQACV